jgi:hypothetical protein
MVGVIFGLLRGGVGFRPAMIGRISRVEHHYRLHNGEGEATTAPLKIAVHPPSDGRELPAMSDQPSSSSVPKPGVQLNEPDVGPAFEPYQRPAGGARGATR